MGYAASWTTGQSYLGFGTGLAGGVTFPFLIHVEIGVLYHAGSIESAANQTLRYSYRQWATLGHAGVGYQLTMFRDRFIVRPQAILGCALLSDSTRLGAETVAGSIPC